MEEKDRYEIHIYDDICVDLYNNGVLDKSINDTYKLEELLNQQSKRLKELEQENQKLKQSQKQLAVEELRRIKEYILINDEYDEGVGCNIIETFDLLEDIRDRIKELSGGENE